MEPVAVPTLHTDRLLLTPIDPAHSRGIFDLWSDPEVCRYSGEVVDYDGNVIDTPCTTRAQSDRIMEFWLHAAHDGWGFRWSILRQEPHPATFIGMAGFNAISPIPEIAFHLHPRFWGKGYMLETASAAMEWATENLHSDRFEAFIEDDNARSIRLATRLGFSATGRHKGRVQRWLRIVNQLAGNAGNADVSGAP